jgi:hypothetical protein
MTHANDIAAHTIADEEAAAFHGAWLGPAIGAGVLTLAWAIYLVPVFIGIVTSVPPGA